MDLQTKISDYKKRASNQLLPASAIAKLNELIAGIESELATKQPDTTPTEVNFEILQSRLKLLQKMVAKKPTATLKTRIKLLEKMLSKKMAGGGAIDCGCDHPKAENGIKAPANINKLTKPELKVLIDQLESGMNDLIASGDTENVKKNNELIGKVIDLYNSKK